MTAPQVTTTEMTTPQVTAPAAPLDTTPEKRMARYLRMGVDAVLADDPAAALAAMKQHVAQ